MFCMLEFDTSKEMGIRSLNNILHLLQHVPLLVLYLLHVNLLAQLAESSKCNASCANPGRNIPYPFAYNSSCAAVSAYESSFLLSCSSHQAYWDTFTQSVLEDESSAGISRPPAVMGISMMNSFIFINLTWDSDLISHPHASVPACSTPISFSNFSNHIPPSIDLASLADSTVRFSHNNVYLLFNCTQSSSEHLSRLQSSNFLYEQTVRADTAACQSYQELCATHMTEYYTTGGKCVQLSPYSDQSKHLGLKHAMQFLACSHFQFFVTKTGAGSAITEWSKSILQLRWANMDCWNCVDSKGSCVMDSTSHTFLQCTNCTGGHPADILESPYCAYKYGCDLSRFGLLSICTNTLKIVVSVVGTVLIVSVGTLIIYCRRRIRRRRSKKSIEKMIQFPKRTAWPIVKQELSSGSNESLDDLDLNSLSERPLEYSYSIIASATSSFSSIVGEGGFGVVFKGAFGRADQAGMQEIAVKVLEVRYKHSRKQFLNEVAIIGRIHHVNVVRLLGFCVEQEDHEMLVYEYVMNGSLDTWLFGSTKRTGRDHAEKILEWGQRYGIAVGVAKGLSYLHEECRHRIVHCDIKPQNILLDASMCPKIADFGLARLMSRDESRVVTLAKGTPGYMAPEFWVGGDMQLSTKADVYSYGMVLLELVSGRRNFALGCRRFPTMACEAAMRNDFESIIDVRLVQAASLATDQEQRFLMWQQVRTAIFAALWCIQEHPASRPCMSEVVQYLEGTTAVPEQPPWPAIASTSATPALLSVDPDTSSCSRLQLFTPMSGGR